MEISPETSAKMANMSALAAFLVVLLHALNPLPKEGFGWCTGSILLLIAKIAVPFFFVAAGYFLANRIDSPGWYGNAVKKRIRSLAIPYFIWCALWWLFDLPILLIADKLHGRPMGESLCFDQRVFGLDLFCSPWFSPMWFLRALFLLVLVSPLVIMIVRRFREWACLFFFIPYCILCPDENITSGSVNCFLRYGFSLFGLFWFAMGIYLRVHGIKYRLKKSLFWVLGVVTMVINLLFLRLRINFHLQPFDIVILMPAIYSFMPAKRYNRLFLENSFAVYLLHPFGLCLCGILIDLVFGGWRETFIALPLQLTLTVVVYLSVACIAGFVRKRFPRTASFLLGGR